MKDMMPTDEIHELRAEIAALRSDMSRYARQAPGMQPTPLLADFRNTCADAIASRYQASGCEAVGNKAENCPMWESCRPVFSMLFEEVLEKIHSGELFHDDIQNLNSRIEALKAHAPSERCESCFAEVEKQMDEELGLLEAIGIYRRDPDTRAAVLDLPEEEAAALFGDALASPVRIQVIKACYDDGKTFTELSKLTGLRGGNLLFHLEKLLKSGIIKQKDDRGEYQITCRGYEMAGMAAEMFMKIR